ncbi:MAG: flagellar biosynthesis anti-sigma factor FlgM [Marinobacter sp.]|nr:flagellar biosynthesis anti-sigma factor FlgM [Marinobacter sp.]
MTVDFNGIGPGQVNTRKTAEQKPAAQPAAQQPAPERAKAAAARADSVSLSDQAKELKKMEEKLAQYPEIDDQRVEQIRAALADGSYKVDAEKLAQKMLEMDKSIFG